MLRTSTSRGRSSNEESPPPPLTVQFLQHLVKPGGYGLDENDVRVGLKQWRESEIIGTLLQNVRAKAPDAVIGRIFTAVNQDGLVVLIGETSEPDDWDESTTKDDAEKKPPSCITDCHLSVCTLDPPVNLGAPDGRMAHAVMLVMVPEDDLTAPWAQDLDRFTTMRTIKSAFKRFAALRTFRKMLTKAEQDLETDRSRQAFAELFRLNQTSARGGGVGGGGDDASAVSPVESPRTSFGPGVGRLRSSTMGRKTTDGGGVGVGRESVEAGGGGGGGCGGHHKSLDGRKTADGHHHGTDARDKGHITSKDLVSALRRAVAIFAESEEARLRAVAEGRDLTAGQPDPVELYQFSGRFGGGVMKDVTERYLPHFFSDWTDGFSLKTVSASLLMYFGCLAPCIAFGALTNLGTNGQMGTMEYLVSQAMAGIVFSVLGGQPEIVLRTTGPTTVFIIELSRVCDSWNLPFIPAMAWVGIWSSMFMVLIALTDLCVPILRTCTRFTQEIFGLFVSAIFITSAGQAFVGYFHDPEYDLALALFSLLLGLLTLQLSQWALAVRSSPFLLKAMRELTADFGTAAAIAAGTLIAWGSGVAGLELLVVSDTIEPAGGRSWLVNLTDGPAWLPAVAVVPALLLTLLMYVEMSISTLLTNKAENNLAKGPAFHLNFLVLALLVLVSSFLGLPFATGSLPHSPQFVRALSDVEEITVGGQTKTRVLWVRENRLAPLLTNVLIALSLVMSPVLSEVPMAVLYGLFLFMGISGLATSQFWTRIKMIFMDPRLLPPTHYVRRVPISRVHAFTGVQLCCLAVLLGVRASPAALFFPLFIASLMPLRMTLSKGENGLFTKEMLKMLDLIGEGSNAETAGEDDGEYGLDAGNALGNVSDWEDSGRRRKNQMKDKKKGSEGVDGNDGGGGGGGGGAKPLKSTVSIPVRRPSYLDLAEVGPDVNGADLVQALTPLAPSETNERLGGGEINPASERRRGQETSTGQVVLEVDAGAEGGDENSKA